MQIISIDERTAEKLCEQIKRDELQELLYEVLDECVEAYYAAGGGIGTARSEDVDHVKTILMTAITLWSANRVDK